MVLLGSTDRHTPGSRPFVILVPNGKIGLASASGALAPGGNSTVYVGTAPGTVYALDAATGAVPWSAPAGRGAVYVGTADGHLVAYRRPVS